MDRDGVLVIRRTRGRAAAWTIGALALAAGSIGYAMRGDLGPILIGGLGVALFLSAAVLLGRDVVRPRDLLRIRPDGLEQLATKPHVFLPWDAIESFSVIERGHRVKTLGITVRDPSALPQAGAVTRAARSRWGGRAVKTGLAGLQVLDSGVSGLRDAADTLREDVAQHATLELATTGLPLRADELAELLSRQRAAALQVSATL